MVEFNAVICPARVSNWTHLPDWVSNTQTSLLLLFELHTELCTKQCTRTDFGNLVLSHTVLIKTFQFSTSRRILEAMRVECILTYDHLLSIILLAVILSIFLLFRQ